MKRIMLIIIILLLFVCRTTEKKDTPKKPIWVKTTNTMYALNFQDRYGCKHTFCYGVDFEEYFLIIKHTNGNIRTNWYGYGNYRDYYYLMDMKQFAEHTNEWPMPQKKQNN